MPIEFPIVELMSSQSSDEWLVEYFHPKGMTCPHCGATFEEARSFRVTKRRQVPDYRCQRCDKTYNVYRGTVFEGRRLRAEPVVLLVRGVVKGEQAQILATEVGVCRQTIQAIRHQMQANAHQMQANNLLEGDEQAETDEMYQNAGEKSEPHLNPSDPPRRRANNARGHGTYDNDRPPMVGTVGRDSGKVRLRMVKHTDGQTLCAHVAQFTQDDTPLSTDEWRGYDAVDRPHATVCHAQKE